MTAEKRVHAMSMRFKNLCGTRKGNITSLVNGPSDKRFWSIVTCRRCLKMRKTARYD